MIFLKFIDKSIEENNLLNKYIENIPLKNRETKKMELESLTKLSYILYFYGDSNNAMLILDELYKLKFENDYDYWTWIEYSIALRALISKNNMDIGGFNNCVDKILSVVNFGEGLQKTIRLKVHSRFMSGEGVELDKSYFQLNKEDVTDLFDFRLIYGMKLVKIMILGGSEKYPESLTIKNLEENIIEMKRLTNDWNVIFKKIRPFN